MDRLQRAARMMLSSDTKNVKPTRAASKERKRSSSNRSKRPPHPIPAGLAGQACPITGLYADGTLEQSNITTATSLAELEADPDVTEEHVTYTDKISKTGKPLVIVEQPAEAIGHFVALNVSDGAHRVSRESLFLVRSIGGLPVLRRFTTIFYERCFVDAHVDQFLRHHSDPHAERFASWIAEKFGDGTPWTEERKSRPRDVMDFGVHGRELVAFDRSSAHFAAWHSPKREPHKIGQHFQPEDARVWMRLHFWAAREAGLFEPQHARFMDYYIRFIAHFISVYSGKSPPFTRESARWSANPRNIERYFASGNSMSDVIDQPLDEALAQLPQSERIYSGSRHHRLSWPYGGPHEMTHLG